MLNILSHFSNIIFDLDNTIYDQKDFDYEVYESLFHSESLAKKLLAYKAVKPYGYPRLFNDFIENENIDITVKECVNFYRSFVPDLDLSPSLLPLISSLKSSDLYLISNGYIELQMKKINALGLSKYFKKIIILDPAVTSKLKPNPDAFYQLNISRQNTIYVGDNVEIDGLFANNAKISFHNFKFNNPKWETLKESI